jgi:NAD(P)-dependent dehydrogenase (short-subunit alcohol dehydrogenase family)
MSKRVLITGATRGLGQETAKQLLADGYQVIGSGRNMDKLEDLKRELGNPNFSIVHMDVTDDESVHDAAQELAKRFESIDVLINNAGIFVDYADSSDVTMDAMRKTMDTNLYGPLRTSQNMLSLLYKSEEARIINVSSGMGAFSEVMAGSAAYRISKTALNSLTAVMSADLNDAIKVVAVCPGWVQTDMGGSSAPRSLEDGAKGIAKLVTLPDLKTGTFYRDGERIAW